MAIIKRQGPTTARLVEPHIQEGKLEAGFFLKWVRSRYDTQNQAMFLKPKEQKMQTTENRLPNSSAVKNRLSPIIQSKINRIVR